MEIILSNKALEKEIKRLHRMYNHTIWFGIIFILLGAIFGDVFTYLIALGFMIINIRIYNDLRYFQMKEFMLNLESYYDKKAELDEKNELGDLK
jgi:hypothetical protein